MKNLRFSWLAFITISVTATIGVSTAKAEFSHRILATSEIAGAPVSFIPLNAPSEALMAGTWSVADDSDKTTSEFRYGIVSNGELVTYPLSTDDQVTNAAPRPRTYALFAKDRALLNILNSVRGGMPRNTIALWDGAELTSVQSIASELKSGKVIRAIFDANGNVLATLQRGRKVEVVCLGCKKSFRVKRFEALATTGTTGLAGRFVASQQSLVRSPRLPTGAALLEGARFTSLHRKLPRKLRKDYSSVSSANSAGEVLVTTQGKRTSRRGVNGLFLFRPGASMLPISLESGLSAAAPESGKGINACGLVVGAAFKPEDVLNKSQWQAFFYHKDFGVRALETLVDPAELGDRKLNVPLSVGDDGLIAVASYIGEYGLRSEVILLKPTDSRFACSPR